MTHRYKTPTVIQMEAVECGAASLGILLGYYHCFVPLEELRVNCGVTRDGSKASNLLEAGKHYGLDGKGGFFSVDDILAQQQPTIVFWQHYHFLVYEGHKGNKVYLNDPAVGPRTVTMEEFKQGFSGIGIVLKPTEKLVPRKKAESFFQSIRKQLGDNTKTLWFIVLTTLLLTFPNLLVAGINQVFIDNYLLLGESDWIRPLIVVMVTTWLVQFGLTYLQRIGMKRFETRLSLSLNHHFVKVLLNLPMRFFSQRQAGDLVARFQANDNIVNAISSQIGISIVQILQLFIYLLVMFCFSTVLAGIALISALSNILLYQAIAKKRRDLSILNKQQNGMLTGLTMSGIQMIETLKATGSEQDFFANWIAKLNDYLTIYQRLSYVNLLSTLLPILTNSLSNGLVLTVGALLVIHGDVTLGGLVAFQSILMLLNAPIKELVDFSSQIQQVEADIKRVEDVYNYPEPEESRNNDLDVTSHTIQGKIEIKHLNFGYNPLADPFIQDFNLTVEPGMRVAIVGPSGCGKSTMAKLITGLYKPFDGEILIDGINITQYSDEQKACIMTMVSQEHFFFKGSIRDNLTLWEQNITADRISQANRDACIRDDISKRPGGINYALTEGGQNFSGGQRQRMEIARSLISNPAILIMDEATSALDPIIEKRVDSNIRRYGITCIIIAHRLSTIRDADKIIVMKNGQIIDTGTHEELMAKQCEVYQSLVQTE